MWKPKWSRLAEWLGRPQGLVLLLLPCLLLLTLYFLSGNEPDFDRIQYMVYRSYNASIEVIDGYLVWNPKCHMLAKDPLDPSIVKFVKKEKFEACSTSPLLTSIHREGNASAYLVVNPEAAKQYTGLTCCWAQITRPHHLPNQTLDEKIDSKINVGPCEPFKDQVLVPTSTETVLVTCKTPKPNRPSKGKVKGKSSSKAGTVYENVHAVLHPERVRARIEAHATNNVTPSDKLVGHKKLSILMLGIDSVSRLNFHRSMPLTRDFFEERGWLELRGYNKMGDNTYPNLMAFLTGQNQSLAYSVCKPKVPHGLDNCPLIWHNFRNAGYVTGYGEDHDEISTFNYLKVGFVDPPTDYYLRPSVLAAERLLKDRKRFSAKYCTGPVLNVDRIYDYAVEFAKTFSGLGAPYFGFFWTNGVSHENMNGPSSIDAHFAAKLRDLEASGVTADSMIVVLSDHGMRYGDIRGTFVGWYEERLPFVYIWLPEWFREQNPSAAEALRINRNRLTSPYDLYETLRDVLSRTGAGVAPASSGCPSCQSLLRPVPRERGCSDVGVAAHWCTCDAFQFASKTDRVVKEGAERFVEHMEGIVGRYRNKKGARLCAKLRLKKIHRVDKVLDLERSPNAGVLELFYLLEVTPGDGMFETTIRYHGPGEYSINDDEVSRINSYAHSAKCLNEGYKQYCHCTK
ncbi:uncharacterized protein LOC106641232 [Copidosoma floridanum]|uniref:uncharacterized protein LOC106641232 n=1 Tax=Copidosoma floridanum TaxID=29053 RepID=UPI0006C98393|nr:uncharacterized protein LOC106641232 [Copidosoma floridanum]XP_014211057.1 uncharacterized protein LOC106641232 [Copidosoma floridanum]